jgi:hypothetical protein
MDGGGREVPRQAGQAAQRRRGRERERKDEEHPAEPLRRARPAGDAVEAGGAGAPAVDERSPAKSDREEDAQENERADRPIRHRATRIR